jgi:hypothetical protein
MGNSACFRGAAHSLLSPRNLLRFELIVLTVPWVLLTVLLRAVLNWSQPTFQGLVPDYALSAFTYPIFLFLSMMFQGVLADFQEAQKVPGALAVKADTLFERANFLGRVAEREGRDGVLVQRALHRELLEYLLALLEFFAGLRSHTDLLALTGALSSAFAEASFAATSLDTDAWFVWQGGEELRALLVRITVIRRTDFLSGGHVLMQLLTVFIVAMFTLSSYTATTNAYGGALEGDTDAGTTMYTSIIGYNGLFLYFLFLYENLEDPFEFDLADLLPAAGDAGPPVLRTQQSSASEVDAAPLLESLARLLWALEGGGGDGAAVLGLASLAHAAPPPAPPAAPPPPQPPPPPLLGASVQRLAAAGDAAPWAQPGAALERRAFRAVLLSRLRRLLGLAAEEAPAAAAAREAQLLGRKGGPWCGGLLGRTAACCVRGRSGRSAPARRSAASAQKATGGGISEY